MDSSRPTTVSRGSGEVSDRHLPLGPRKGDNRLFRFLDLGPGQFSVECRRLFELTFNSPDGITSNTDNDDSFHNREPPVKVEIESENGTHRKMLGLSVRVDSRYLVSIPRGRQTGGRVSGSSRGRSTDVGDFESVVL